MRGLCHLLVVCLWCSPAVLFAEEAPDVSGATLKVLTYNVWHGLRSGESNKRFPGEDAERMARRFELQIEEIRRLDPDVLLLQEVNPNQRQARKYAEALGFDEIHKVASCGLHLGAIYKIPRNMNEGLAILAKPELGLERFGKKRLSGNAKCTASWGFQTKESRYGLFGEITVGERKVLLVTTHLSSPPFVPSDFEERLAELVDEGALEAEQRDEILAARKKKQDRNLGEAQKLLAEIDRHRQRLAGSGTPPAVIFSGDFNSEPDTASVATVRQAGFQTAGTGPDFLSWDPVTNHVNYHIGSKRAEPLPTFGVAAVEEMLAIRKTNARQIDHVFASDELEVVSAEMVLDQEHEGMYLSDHFGILATLRLP